MKLTEKQYAQALFEATDGKTEAEAGQIVSNLFELLIRGNRVRLAKKIIDRFSQIWDEKNGIIKAEVISRESISADASMDVIAYVKDKYRAKEVILNNIIDEGVKGGIIIKVGDEVIDASIGRRLKDLRMSLSK